MEPVRARDGRADENIVKGVAVDVACARYGKAGVIVCSGAANTETGGGRHRRKIDVYDAGAFSVYDIAGAGRCAACEILKPAPDQNIVAIVVVEVSGGAGAVTAKAVKKTIHAKPFGGGQDIGDWNDIGPPGRFAKQYVTRSRLKTVVLGVAGAKQNVVNAIVIKVTGR